jgi:AAA family ATP:ADP antiporter
MRPTLERALRIHSDEFRPLALLALIFFTVQAGLEVVGNIAEIIFFRRVGVNKLPGLYIWEPVIMVTLLLFFGPIVDRLGRHRLLMGLNVIFIAGLLIARPLLFADWHPVYPALWLLQRVFYGLFPLLFWVICNDVFDIRQGKRLFTLILASGLAGATFGNLITGLLSRWFVAEDVLLTAMIIFVAGMVAIEALRRMPQPARPRRAAQVVQKEFSLGLPRHLLREPFLQALFLLMIIIGLLEPVVRYELNALSNQLFTAERDVITFYGFFKAGGALLIAFLQATLAGRLVEKMGVPSLLSVLPLGYLCVLPLLGLFPNVYLGAGAVAALVTLAVSFHSPARSSTLNLFPAEERGRISAFADQLWYIGWGLGSLFLIWAAQAALSLSQINFLAALVAAVWLLILPSLRQRYARTCLRSTVLPFDRQLASIAPFNGRADPRPLIRFQALLDHSAPNREQHLALAVEGFKLRNPDVEARLRSILAQAGEASQSHLLQALRSPSWAVRRGALQLLGTHLTAPDQIASAIAAQVRHAFTLMLLTLPLETDGTDSVWNRLRIETGRAGGAASLLLLELIHPPEQMQAVARMIHSGVRATHATGLEALDNLTRFKDKRHLLDLIGDTPVDEQRRRAAKWLETQPTTTPDEALHQLTTFPDGLIRFWARHEACQRRLYVNGHFEGGAGALIPPEPELIPLLAPLIFPDQEDAIMELAKKITALRATTAFGALSEEELKIIALCLHEHHFAARQVVCEAGQRGEALYVLVEGQMELASAGNRQDFRTLEPGEVFGEVSLLAAEPYALTAVTLTPARLLSLDREALNALINYYPPIALGLMQALALRLSQTANLLQKDWV